MGERHQRISSLDRQMLVAAYSPVIVLAALLITARVFRRRNKFETGG
jgi:hypothetical protein